MNRNLNAIFNSILKLCVFASLRELILFGCFLLITYRLEAQLVPHLTLEGHWNGRGSQLGVYSYNSLWGWSANGREYAILGSVDTIYFFDITNPKQPKLCDAKAGRYNNAINREFKTYKNYCYAVADQGSPSSMQIFDLKYLPDSVHKVYDTDTLCTQAHNLYIDDDRLYLAWNKKSIKNHLNEYPLTVVSLKNPEAPTFISNLASPYFTVNGQKRYFFEIVHDLFVRNDTAYCSCGNDGLYIFDYKDPLNPKWIGYYIAGNGDGEYNHSNWLSPDGNILSNTCENNGVPVKLFDVSQLKDTGMVNNPLELQTLSTFGSNVSLGSTGHNSFIKGNLVYMSYYQDGVVVFDKSDPNNVKEIASYDTYPQNGRGNYSPWAGCWNVYPFFASGSIIASDMTNGLFVLKMDSVSAIDSRDIYDNQLNIKILENPFHDHIDLNVNSEINQELSINIYDLLGKSLFANNYQCAEGKSTISIPWYSYPTGSILLSITSTTAVYSRKLIKE